MKKVLFLSFFLLIFRMVASQPSGENKVIFTLHGDKPNASYLLAIAEPLDGLYNRYAATFKQTITESNKVEFIYKKQYPAVIRVEVAGRYFNVIMQANTTVYADIYPQIETNDWLVFSGDNAAGHQLYHSKTVRDWMMEFDKIYKDYKKNCPDLISHVEATLYPIDSLKALKEISGSFAEVLKKERLVMAYWSVVNDFFGELVKAKIKGSSFTAADSIAIRGSIDEIFSTFPPLAPDILAYHYGRIYVDIYSIATYRDRNMSSDKRYVPEFDSWGIWGFLPDKLQKAMMGSGIAAQYRNNTNEFDKTKALAYFREKYPDSEFLPIIDNLIERYRKIQEEVSKDETPTETASVTEKKAVLKGNITTIAEGIYIDTSAVTNHITTLKELHATYFKGKKIFIDLWATWCAPCIHEFTYKEQLDSLLKIHTVTPVFLSLDIPSTKEQWIQFIDSKKLTGYHFLPNNTLIKDIRRIAGYTNPASPMSIPHYIYMDEQGNIIEKDAPRPSQTEKLGDLFRKK